LREPIGFNPRYALDVLILGQIEVLLGGASTSEDCVPVRESAEPLNETAVLLLIGQVRLQPHFGKQLQALLMYDR
jgi:hypothetical protein